MIQTVKLASRTLARQAPGRLYSSSSSPAPPKPLSRRILRFAALAATCYAGIAYYASTHPAQQHTIERWVPGTAVLVDMLEERDYKRTGAKASMSTLMHEADFSSFKNASRHAQQSSDSGQDADDGRHKHSSATSASADPLSPTYFFNAVSGTASTTADHAYLPLILLPDDNHQNPHLHAAASNLNDLIATFNSGAGESLIPEQTIKALGEALDAIPARPGFREVLHGKARRFRELHERYRLLWDAYLDTQDQITNGGEGPRAKNPVLGEYNRSVRKEIQETENVLVRLVNSRSRGDGKEGEEDLSEEEVRRIRGQEAAPPARAARKQAVPVPVAATPAPQQQQQQKQKQEQEETVPYGHLNTSDPAIQLTLFLTLLAKSLQTHSAATAAVYMEKVKEIAKGLSKGEVERALEEVSGEVKEDLKKVLKEAVH